MYFLLYSEAWKKSFWEIIVSFPFLEYTFNLKKQKYDDKNAPSPLISAVCRKKFITLSRIPQQQGDKTGEVQSVSLWKSRGSIQ